ncbi:Protein of unknown function [Pyronema omphalodes CBS 100304]|uniref:Uncharacterized protein n=1 Tax=Pyronema omphalodes (strain CBS 100304) TaxID=1076935 RepID=U4LL91_PYROM|nr:Protein of unknown function [Pyronema omphalodes CBS 100304]
MYASHETTGAVYKQHKDHSIAPYFHLIPITTASKANLAAEKMCATECGGKYCKEAFSNGLAV